MIDLVVRWIDLGAAYDRPLVEGLEEPLRLAPICRLPRRGKEEAPLLELKVLVCGPGRNGIEWTVISAGRIDAPSAAVEKQIDRCSGIPARTGLPLAPAPGLSR